MKYIAKIILILVSSSTFSCKFYHYSNENKNENENTSLYFFPTFFFISHPGLLYEEVYYTINEDTTLPIKQKFLRLEYSKSPENNKLYEIHITADSEFYLRIHFDDDNEEEKLSYFYFQFNLGMDERIEILGLMEMLYDVVKFTYDFTYIENNILSQTSENKSFQVDFSPEEISYVPTGNGLPVDIKPDSNAVLEKERPKKDRFSLIKVLSKTNLNKSQDKTKPAHTVRRTQTKQEVKSKQLRKRFSFTTKGVDLTKVVNNDIPPFTIAIKHVEQISIELGQDEYVLNIRSIYLPQINMHFTSDNYEKLFFINYCKLLPKISCKKANCKLPEIWSKSVLDLKQMTILVTEYVNGKGQLWKLQ
jgi:hypothetical protein